MVPIINENDVNCHRRVGFGDNDQLSAYVTENFNAELLVILSDIDALYDKDPRASNDAKVRKEVNFITQEELDAAPSANNEFATGGIVTKLKAASFLLKHGKQMFLLRVLDWKMYVVFLLMGNSGGEPSFAVEC